MQLHGYGPYKRNRRNLIMKLLKKIFYAISGLIFLSGLLMLFCMLNPKLTDSLADRLYSGRPVQAETVPDEQQNQGDRDTERRNQQETASDESAKSGNEPAADSAQYIPPAQEDITVPDTVAERSGYVPVQEEAQQIEDEEAELLLERTGYGETGDGLEFEALYYPYYHMLDAAGQHIYRQIYANALELNDTFVPIEQIRENALKDAYLAVYNDHPELFWLDGGYTGKCMPNGICAEVTLRFNRTAGNLTQASEEFRAAADRIMGAAQQAETVYETEVLVHQAILDNTEYRLNAPMNQSAYSALVNGQSVCAGYARAFQYVMQQLGIPSYYCTGYAGMDHAWNIVLLEGDYYNVDATWNDTEPNTLDYFNKTDTDFASTHVRQELSVYLPACRGNRYAVPSSAAAVPEEDILYSLQDYYNDCYARALQNVGGEVIEFENYLSGEALMQEWNHVYQQDAYAQGYVNQLLTDIGIPSCELNVQVERVSDGLYRLKHSIRLISER